MFKFLTLEEETFGLDINDLSMKIVKLKKKRRGFVLVSFNEEKIAPGIIDGGVVKNEEALVKIIKLAKCMTALPPWTGWFRNRKEVSPLPPRPLLVSGRISRLI